MNVIAAVLILVLVPLFLWAWRSAPGAEAARQFTGIWNTTPWGRQIVVDFFALEVVLALWMVADAGSSRSWLLALPCLAAMPVFGAIPAAAYWLLRGFFQ